MQLNRVKIILRMKRKSRDSHQKKKRRMCQCLMVRFEEMILDHPPDHEGQSTCKKKKESLRSSRKKKRRKNDIDAFRESRNRFRERLFVMQHRWRRWTVLIHADMVLTEEGRTDRSFHTLCNATQPTTITVSACFCTLSCFFSEDFRKKYYDWARLTSCSH